MNAVVEKLRSSRKQSSVAIARARLPRTNWPTECHRVDWVRFIQNLDASKSRLRSNPQQHAAIRVFSSRQDTPTRPNTTKDWWTRHWYQMAFAGHRIKSC